MQLNQILYAVLALGGIAVVFGLVLTFAAKAFAVPVDDRVAAVRAALPGANCGACGFAGCDAFAEAVVEGRGKTNGCPPGGQTTASAVAAIMGTDAGVVEPTVAKVICQGATGVSKQRYQYDGMHSCRMASDTVGGPKECPYACIGLGDCVEVCAFDALRIEDGLAVVDEDKCTACGMCENVCPRQSIQLRPRSANIIVRCQNRDVGRLARQECAKACIGCRACEKKCQFDAIHVNDGFAAIDNEKCTRCGECVKACPMKCITLDGEMNTAVLEKVEETAQ